MIGLPTGMVGVAIGVVPGRVIGSAIGVVSGVVVGRVIGSGRAEIFGSAELYWRGAGCRIAKAGVTHGPER